MVRYVDSSGWTWEVCELDDKPPHAPPAARRETGAFASRHELADRASKTASTSADGGGTLYFISRRGTRKLNGYPRVWSSLPRQQLEALCDRAVAIGTGPY